MHVSVVPLTKHILDTHMIIVTKYSSNMTNNYLEHHLSLLKILY